MQLIRSLIFTAYMMLTACCWGTFMALCFWLPYEWQFKMARVWARNVFWMLEKLCGLTYAVEGREHIPAGNHIVMSNHTSSWETIAHFLLFPPQVWVLKRELMWIPFVGWGIAQLRPISINRGAGHRAVNQVVDQGKQRLADGLWVVIFPEGTRVKPGEQRKFGVSGALLATETHKMVVPLAHNAGDFWVRRGIVKKPGVVRVVIGEPIDSTGKNPRALNDQVRQAIDAGLKRIAGSGTS
jgi:1-acyl-sn-glycerol-3-phosphate acyltransferase